MENTLVALGAVSLVCLMLLSGAVAGCTYVTLPARPAAQNETGREHEDSSADTVHLGTLTGRLTDNPVDGRQRFSLSLQAAGTAQQARPALRNLSIARYGAGRPEPGRYPLAPMPPGTRRTRDSGGQFFATVALDSAGSLAAMYVSVEGVLEVTYSAADRIEGTLRFTAAEYFAQLPGGTTRGSGAPDSVADDAARRAFTASFVAERTPHPVVGYRPAEASPPPEASAAPVLGARGSRLATDEKAYAPGDTLVLTLTAGRARLVYNLCHVVLYRWEGNAWERYPLPSRYVDAGVIPACTDEGYYLEPGAQASYAIRLHASLIEGSYRFEAEPVVTPRDPVPERVATAAFEVQQ